MNKVALTGWIDKNAEQFTQLADEIWAHPEVAWDEYTAVRLQARLLQDHGFAILENVGGIETAFSAQWGKSGPVIGFLGEYDALPGLSQKSISRKAPVIPDAPGHGCGHNLLGTGCLSAAVAAKCWLESTGSAGTVRYYGCPGEEQISGKTFMAREGAFDDLSAALNYHPGTLNMPGKGTAIGVNDITFRFAGTAAHAGGSPEKGRSALDAVELMNVGVNYLREHVPEKVRIHYAITHGGDVPNIVPDRAEVWYFIRALERDVLDEVTNRVRKIAQGAAMMTDTEVSEVLNGACLSVLNNHYLADLHYRAMETIGPIDFTEEEMRFAGEINNEYPKENARNLFRGLRIPDEWKQKVETLKKLPLAPENLPAMNQEEIGTGSTDVGDVSWITPLTMFRTACFPTGATGHSWGITAASGTTIGHKGMLHAAKIMALVAVDLFKDPEHLRAARKEFEEKTQGNPYTCPIPANVAPPKGRN